MPDRTHECTDFHPEREIKRWKTSSIESTRSPRYPKFQQASTGFRRTLFVLFSCEVKVKSKSEKPAAATGKARKDFLLLEAFHIATLKILQYARARGGNHVPC